MKRLVLLVAVTTLIVQNSRSVWADDPVEIAYRASDLGSGRWAYDYRVRNLALESAVREFTIFFDYGNFDNLAVDSTNEIRNNWDELVAQPDDFLKHDGFYDALALHDGIPVGAETAGFRVTFDWLGDGVPASQRFDVVDPETFDVLFTGQTIPEPATALLMAIAVAFAPRRRIARSMGTNGHCQSDNR